MLMKQWLSFVSTKTNKQNEGNCFGKSNVIHFQKQLVPTRSVEPEKNQLCEKFWMLGAGTEARNLSFGSTVLIPTTANLAPGCSLQVF